MVGFDGGEVSAGKGDVEELDAGLILKFALIGGLFDADSYVLIDCCKKANPAVLLQGPADDAVELANDIVKSGYGGLGHEAG